MTPASDPASRASADESTRAARLREHLRRWGLLRTLYQRLMGRLSPRLTVAFAFTRPLDNLKVLDSYAGCSLRMLSREDLLRAAPNPEQQMTPEFVEEAMARGDLCVGALHDGELVSYVWQSFIATRHRRDIWLTFRPPYRYAFKSLTLPAWRGRQLTVVLAPVIDRICVERGWTQGIAFIETHNFPSLAASKKLGNVCIGVIGYLRLGRRVFTFRTAGPRRLGFGFVHRPDGTPPP